MNKITLKDFFERMYAPNVQYGKDLWNKGGVIYTSKESPDEYSALVESSGSNYRVKVEFDGDEIIDTSCTCSNDWADYCRHVIGVLFELRKSVIRKPKKTNPKAKIEAITNKLVVPEDLSAIKKITPDKRLETFRDLSEELQRILKILALSWEPLSQTKLMEYFNGSDFRIDNKNLYAKDAKSLLLRLTKMGYLQQNRENKYSCNESFADELCLKYFADNLDFKNIADYIAQHQRNRYAYYSNDRSSMNQLFRDMRIARFAGDGKAFKENYNKLLHHPYGDYTQESLCAYWLPAIFSLENIESYAIEIRGYLLEEKLTLQLFFLEKVDGYFYYTIAHLASFSKKAQQSLAYFLVHLHLMRGEWKAIEKIITYLPVDELGTTTAIRQFIVGDNPAALASFEAALKLHRKISKDNKVYFHNMEGVFHILARFKSQDAANLKKADSHLAWAVRNSSFFDNAYKWLQAVRLYLKNQKTAALQQLKNVKEEEPLVLFLKPFCHFWIDASEVEDRTVKVLYNKTRDNGYQWLATELLALQNALVPDNFVKEALLEKELKIVGNAPLIHVLPRIEDWELAIKALMELGVNQTKTVQTEHRLVWLIDFSIRIIQAKGQTLNKSGWTKGRVISYDRLKKRDIAYLTPQDERIIDSIGHAYGSEVSFNNIKVMKQLLGHPLLFLMKSPQVAVQFITEKPRLIARKEDNGGFRLSFSHQIEKAGFQIIKESPTRYILVEITEKMAQIAKTFNGNSLRVPEKGATALQAAISGLPNTIAIESTFEEANLPTVPADSRACVHLLPVGDGFHVEIYAKPFGNLPPYVKIGQGEPTLITLKEGVKTATNRDLKQEKQNLKQLRIAVPTLQKLQPRKGTWELDDEAHCLQFLLELAPLVEAKSIILEWPKGEKFSITQIAGMDQFRMEINEKNNWFELTGTLPIDEKKVLTMQELLALSNSKEQFVELGKGKFLALTKEFRERLAQINGLVNTQRNGTIQLHPLAAPAIQGFTDALKHLKVDPKFTENKEKLKKAFNKKFKVAKSFKATLRPYQQEGFQWLHRCAAWGVGACLADDMGLGKTIQALALLTDRAKLGPALVIAPASVCRNWMAETKKFAPTLIPILFGEGNREAMLKKAGKKDLIIATYDLMTRERTLFTNKKFGTIILDEAQAIKNRATKRSETAMELQADFKIIMTGTPVENHLGELWNLFQFANPGLLGSLGNFTKKFAIPIEKDKDEDRRGQLRRLLQPFILRRKKGEVLKDLPEKTEITLTATLSTEERAFYEALRRNALEKLAGDDSSGGQKHLKILAEIMKLRRAACHPKLADKNATFIESAKLNLFTEIVTELLANDHKALVFSQFVGHLKLLENYLKKQKIAYQYLDGQTPLAKRQQRIDAFQAGEGVIFLISLKAGGTGLNLTAADYVLHMDPWWNPAVEDQATDRAHRMGQERPVTVYRLVAEGTIEEQILQLHEKKRDLADSLLTGTDVSAKLTAKDLLALIGEGNT